LHLCVGLALLKSSFRRRVPIRWIAFFSSILLSASVGLAQGNPARQTKVKSVSDLKQGGEKRTQSIVVVKGVRHWSSTEVTHVAIDLNGPVRFKFGHLIYPERIYFDLQDAKPSASILDKDLEDPDGVLTNVRVGKSDAGGTRVALDLAHPVEYSVTLTPDPYRLEISLRRKDKSAGADHHSALVRAIPDTKRSVAASTLAPNPTAALQAIGSAHEAKPGSNGGRSLVRALGLKVGKIVIDPGHGGDDHGTMGAGGLSEKDVVLDIAMRLGRLLQAMGAEVSYTRAIDGYLPLEARTAIANREGADLFISIHANSNPDHAVRGLETYYLNFTSSRDSLEVAARENTVAQHSVNQLRDLVQKIAQQDKIEESREFARRVQNALAKNLSQARSLGVKEAPFVVLTGANMPAILTEISFLSNVDDENQLKDPSYRQQLAQGLYEGISGYIEDLGGISPRIRVGSNIPVIATKPELFGIGWGAWKELVLDFVAANRMFVIVALLLAGVWTFFLTSPAPLKPEADHANQTDGLPSKAGAADNLIPLSSNLKVVQRS